MEEGLAYKDRTDRRDSIIRIAFVQELMNLNLNMKNVW